MANGYHNRWLFVDLDSGALMTKDADPSVYQKYVGGYGVGARILFDQMKKGVDPLGPDNILGFVTGPLTGTEAQISSRYTVVAKSPLTHTWGDANSGGWFGPKLKSSGFDAVFFRGISPDPVYLLLQDGKAEIKRADQFWGLDTFQTEDALRQEYGNKAEIACIGQGGEKLSLISGIVCNKGRLAARSGVGAVMGSKRLKAIVALGGVPIHVAHPQWLKDLRAEYIKTQCIFADMYKTTGTPGLVEGAAYSGDMPTKNWQSDVRNEDFVLKNISADAVLDKQAKKWGCYQCSLACGGVMQNIYEVKDSRNHSHKPEYETIASLGTLCMNDDLLTIVKGADLCNRYGIDSMSAGSTIAFAMDLYAHGIINRDQVGLDLTWGNSQNILTMLEWMGKRQGFGDVLADGVFAAANRIGNGAHKFAYHIQGQELPMHDPKYYPGMAPGYHLDDTPARHMHNNGWAITAPTEWLAGIGIKDPEPNTYQGQGKNFMILSAQSHFMNALGVCILGWFSNLPSYMYQFTNAVTGWNYDYQEATNAGERIANIRHAFNLREGHNPRKWPTPGIMSGNPPLNAGPLANVTLDMEILDREWLQAYHWDVDTTIPDPQRLRELGIPEIIDDLDL